MLYTRLVILLSAIIIDDDDCVVFVELIDNIIQLNKIILIMEKTVLCARGLISRCDRSAAAMTKMTTVTTTR